MVVAQYNGRAKLNKICYFTPKEIELPNNRKQIATLAATLRYR